LGRSLPSNAFVDNAEQRPGTHPTSNATRAAHSEPSPADTSSTKILQERARNEVQAMLARIRAQTKVVTTQVGGATSLSAADGGSDDVHHVSTTPPPKRPQAAGGAGVIMRVGRSPEELRQSLESWSSPPRRGGGGEADDNSSSSSSSSSSTLHGRARAGEGREASLQRKAREQVQQMLHKIKRKAQERDVTGQRRMASPKNKQDTREASPSRGDAGEVMDGPADEPAGTSAQSRDDKLGKGPQAASVGAASPDRLGRQSVSVSAAESSQQVVRGHADEGLPPGPAPAEVAAAASAAEQAPLPTPRSSGAAAAQTARGVEEGEHPKSGAAILRKLQMMDVSAMGATMKDWSGDLRDLLDAAKFPAAHVTHAGGTASPYQEDKGDHGSRPDPEHVESATAAAAVGADGSSVPPVVAPHRRTHLATPSVEGFNTQAEEGEEQEEELAPRRQRSLTLVGDVLCEGAVAAAVFRCIPWAGLRGLQRVSRGFGAAVRLALGRRPQAVIVGGGHRGRALRSVVAFDTLLCGGPQATAEAAARRGGGGADSGWCTLPSMGVERNNCAVCTLPGGGGILVAGGYNLRGLEMSAERFDPGRGRWEQAAPMPSRRSGCRAVGLEALGVAVVLGGYGEEHECLAAVETYDWRRDEWNTLTRIPPLATPRYDCAACALPAGWAAAFPSCVRPILTEMYLCHACSCHERLSGNAAAGGWWWPAAWTGGRRGWPRPRSTTLATARGWRCRPCRSSATAARPSGWRP
jgi:hypothetical protein